MPTSIAIVCTLDELTAYSLNDKQNRYFSLNLSVGLKGDLALPADSAADIFLPWRTPTIDLVVYADAGQPGDQPSGNTVTPNPISSSVAADGVIARLETRYKTNNKPGNESYFHWDDDPSAPPSAQGGETWSRLLAHASTYPAPIPESLNLAFVFSLPVTGANSLQGLTRLFVAPQFTLDGTTIFAPNPAPEKPGTTLVEWKYASAPQGYQNAMSAFQPEFILATVPSPLPALHFIDPYTGWIATSDGTNQSAPAESLASEDWHATLERRAGEAFDLGQRILVVLRARIGTIGTTWKPTFADVDVIRDAVLAVLRDTADVGLRYGPDGTNLVRFILLRSGVNDPSMVQNIEQELHVATSGKGVPDPARWLTFLNRYVATNVAAAPGNPSAPATADYLSATLNMLDTAQSALATDAVLANLIFDQWDTYLTSTNWQGIRSAVQQKLQSFAQKPSTDPASTESRASRVLRGRMLLAAMGGQAPPDSSKPVSTAVPVWTALTATPPMSAYTAETQAVQGNLQDLMAAYFFGRLGLTSTSSWAQYISLFANRAPAAAWPLDNQKNPNPDLTADLRTDAGQFGTTVLFPPTNQRTMTSHPIIVQIGDTTPKSGLALTADLERKVAGVGLLIQEENSAWTCANMANLYVAGQSTALVSAVPVPIRLKTRNNLRQPYLNYNSGSLVAQDLTDPKGQDFPHYGDVFPPVENSDWGPLYQYQLDPPAGNVVYTENNGNFTLTFPDYVPPGNTLADWSRVPALKFGKTYTLLPFTILNSGAVPPLLASTTNPFVPVKPGDFAANWANGANPPVLKPPKPLVGYTRTVKYLRRVAVGAPRLPNGSDTAFPAIPSSVVPLARDVLGSPDYLAPILLLWGAQNTFSFSIRPPACDLETWDRWTAGLTETQQQTQNGLRYRYTRMSVASAVGRFSTKTTGIGINQQGPDLSIDDPAVSKLRFSLQPVYSSKAAPNSPDWNTVSPPPIAATINGAVANLASILMNPVQSTGVAITCSTGAAPGLALANNQLSVTVPPGEVWRLTATPGLTDPSRFEDFASANPGIFELLIEVPISGIFAPGADTSAFQKTLWNQFAVQRSDGHFQVTFSPWGDLTKPDPTRDLIHDVDLRRQAWRWTGRPIAPFPSDWAGATPVGDSHIDDAPALDANNIPNSRMWEIGSFAERLDDDCVLKTTAVNFASANSQSVQLHDLDVSADLRAQYYRFAIDVHSRYEGLSGLPVTTIRARTAVTAPNGGYTYWKRQVIPPRFSGDLPKPKILLVIPLTIPGAEGGTLPDLLAIANEPCFGIGGLAEEVRSQLIMVPDPSFPLNVPLGQANPLPEVGPNQILLNKAMDQTLIGPPADLAAEPIGTTFDLNTPAPLFGNTCFRITSSMLGLPVANLDHYFVKISFTRRINLLLVGPAGAPRFLESKPTDPFWVEFQPSFDHCRLSGQEALVEVSSLTFSISNGAVTFFQGATPVTPIAGPPDSPRLELWLLLMSTIKDVTGAGETFAVDMIGPSFKTSQADSADLVVFLLEVETSPDYNPVFDSGIAKAVGILFPDPSGSQPNVTARVKRSSPYIPNRL